MNNYDLDQLYEFILNTRDINLNIREILISLIREIKEAEDGGGNTSQYIQIFGNGISNVHTITHGLNTRNLSYILLNNQTGDEFMCDFKVINQNQIRLTTFSPIANNMATILLK